MLYFNYAAAAPASYVRARMRLRPAHLIPNVTILNSYFWAEQSSGLNANTTKHGCYGYCVFRFFNNITKKKKKKKMSIEQFGDNIAHIQHQIASNFCEGLIFMGIFTLRLVGVE